MHYSRYLTDGTETDEVQEPENFSGRRREYLEFGYVRETYTDSQDIPSYQDLSMRKQRRQPGISGKFPGRHRQMSQNSTVKMRRLTVCRKQI